MIRRACCRLVPPVDVLCLGADNIGVDGAVAAAGYWSNHFALGKQDAVIAMGTAHRSAAAPLATYTSRSRSSDAGTSGGARALLPCALESRGCRASVRAIQPSEICTTQPCNRSGIGYNWEAGLR